MKLLIVLSIVVVLVTVFQIYRTEIAVFVDKNRNAIDIMVSFGLMMTVFACTGLVQEIELLVLSDQITIIEGNKIWEYYSVIIIASMVQFIVLMTMKLIHSNRNKVLFDHNSSIVDKIDIQK